MTPEEHLKIDVLVRKLKYRFTALKAIQINSRVQKRHLNLVE